MEEIEAIRTYVRAVADGVAQWQGGDAVAEADQAEAAMLDALEDHGFDAGRSSAPDRAA